MYAKSFKELVVWQRAMELAGFVYKLTSSFPKVEMYGLVSQMQRAAISIPSNIAEGYNRKNRKEYMQFLHIAAGSLAELETQVLLAEKIYVDQDYSEIKNCLNEVSKMLHVMILRLA